MPEVVPRSNLLCLVFTDLVDSTQLKSRVGDAAASELMAGYHPAVLALAAECNGREIDSAGDGFFLTFDAPSSAVTFSLRLQVLHSERPELPAVRIGVHLGEVTERPAPAGSSKPTLVEGIAVDLAARIGSLAVGNQVLMSLPVFNAARQRLDEGNLGRSVSWLAHGPYLFKGIDEPVEIGEAGIAGLSPLRPPEDSDKARSATRAGDELTLGWRPAVGLAVPGRANWHLVSQLGVGAIGEVWLATHEGTRARRVFKFCFQADSLRSLKREVALLRVLKNNLGDRSDIAQVIDWEFDSPPYFLETEHSEAGDLVDWTRACGGIDKVPIETRIALGAQIAEALAAAHGAGVLHKDLKPANVLIHEAPNGEPRVCLSDFGIGLLTSRESVEVPGVTMAGLTEALLSSSIDTGAGTRLYMAPELMEGRPGTELSDVYSLGVILYQLAACDFNRALASGWERDVADSLLREDIKACVDHDLVNRVSSASELARRLRAHSERAANKSAAEQRGRAARFALGAAAALVLAAGLWWAYEKWNQVNWAREVAGPEIQLAIEANDWSAAYDLAAEVESALGVNPALDVVWKTISTKISFVTEPAGATVSYKPYSDVNAPWRLLGTTPVLAARVPVTMMRWRIEKDGYETREIAHKPSTLSRNTPFERSPKLILDPVGSAPLGTTAIEAGTYAAVPLGSFPAVGSFEMARAYLDRTEVTNSAYQEFVNDRGYERTEYWTMAFENDGAPLSFEESMKRFTDSTGRPGPAGWVQGEFPEGRAEYPVSGVSWYEAVAYANYRGRSLPTIYHWAIAALPDAEIIESLAPELTEFSNLGGRSVEPVGTQQDLSAMGAKDMAGNVSEWVWNETGGKRYTLGSSWDDPKYHFSAAAAASPWQRLETNGFRLVTYSDSPAARLLAPVDLPQIDYFSIPAMTDAEAELVSRLALYDDTPLNVREEGSFELEMGGVAKRYTMDAAYRGERLIVYVIEPERAPSSAEPASAEAVIFMGGLDILAKKDTEAWIREASRFLDFVRKSGRMTVLPIYSGSLERNNGRTLQRFNQGPISQGELINEWSKDVGRTLDYLTERGDVEMDSLAYVGLSLGAAVAPSVVGRQSRFATVILWSGGFAASAFPENAPSNVYAVEHM